jgi:hypothetical protein
VSNDALIGQYLQDELIGHISRDSTAIVGRENQRQNNQKNQRSLPREGGPAKDEQRESLPEKRLDRQVNQSAEEAVLDLLPVACDRGAKKKVLHFGLLSLWVDGNFNCHHGTKMPIWKAGGDHLIS